MSRAPAIDIKELAGRLAEHIDRLVTDSLPGAVLEGGLWRAGDLAGNPGRSLVVWRTGTKRGEWTDFASGEWGDALDLVAQCGFAGDKAAACAWARSYLGLDNMDPQRLELTRRQARARAGQAERQAAKDLKAARRRAQAHWLEAVPIAGTPAERYLRETRAIDLRPIGRFPGCARYTHKLWNAESRRHWPAILWAVTAADGSLATIHRQWLEVRTDGTVDKAPLTDVRASYCAYRGACIRLWKGVAGIDPKTGGCKMYPSPWKSPPDWIALGEGAETGLSVVVTRPTLPVAAAVSLANMANVELPDGTGVILLRENDWDNNKAGRQFDRAVAAFLRQGRRVKVVTPAAGSDLNDRLRAG